ncbi:MAG: hypothetical protein K8U57_34745 [Planctomycetes bacterium]|nr:hypothetical protein [Planctomycetota bacterium]
MFAPVGKDDSPVIDSYRTAHPSKGSRFDWIGVSRDWKVVSAGIDHTSRDGRTPSDHFPVTAVLQR